jgi:hypothetical protein
MNAEKRQRRFRKLFAANAVLFAVGATGLALAYHGFELIGFGLFGLAWAGGCGVWAMVLNRLGRSDSQ